MKSKRGKEKSVAVSFIKISEIENFYILQSHLCFCLEPLLYFSVSIESKRR